MSELDSDTLRREIQKQFSRVAALRRAVYAQQDPSAADELTGRLSEAEITLADLESQARVKAVNDKPVRRSCLTAEGEDARPGYNETRRQTNFEHAATADRGLSFA